MDGAQSKSYFMFLAIRMATLRCDIHRFLAKNGVQIKYPQISQPTSLLQSSNGYSTVSYTNLFDPCKKIRMSTSGIWPDEKTVDFKRGKPW